jgi:hypothetical protein
MLADKFDVTVSSSGTTTLTISDARGSSSLCIRISKDSLYELTALLMDAIASLQQPLGDSEELIAARQS